MQNSISPSGKLLGDNNFNHWADSAVHVLLLKGYLNQAVPHCYGLLLKVT